MRALIFALACLVGSGCSPQPVFEDLSACLGPADPSSPAAGSLPALVDRADVIVSVKVTKAERIYTGYHDRLGARRLTLQTIETAKGSAPAMFVVTDGPCPLLSATEGESFIALLEPTPDAAALKPVGLPTSKLVATSTRTLPQLIGQIRSIRALDGEARALFERYGWAVTAKRDFGEFDLPPLTAFGSAARELRGAAPDIDQPLETYAALSSEVGLDLRSSAGKSVERLSFWLERSPPEYRTATPFGHVLIAERRIVAAWVTVFPEGGPFSIRDRAGALAGTSARLFPPANRFPAGVNVARLYDLASAVAIEFKTGAGGNGTITDPARVRAFAAALDAMLPTMQAVVEREAVASRYYLSVRFERSIVYLEYDARDGLLTVLADGYAVRPGRAFASIVAEIR